MKTKNYLAKIQTVEIDNHAGVGVCLAFITLELVNCIISSFAPSVLGHFYHEFGYDEMISLLLGMVYRGQKINGQSLSYFDPTWFSETT